MMQLIRTVNTKEAVAEAAAPTFAAAKKPARLDATARSACPDSDRPNLHFSGSQRFLVLVQLAVLLVSLAAISVAALGSFAPTPDLDALPAAEEAAAAARAEDPADTSAGSLMCAVVVFFLAGAFVNCRTFLRIPVL